MLNHPPPKLGKYRHHPHYSLHDYYEHQHCNHLVPGRAGLALPPLPARPPTRTNSCRETPSSPSLESLAGPRTTRRVASPESMLASRGTSRVASPPPSDSAASRVASFPPPDKTAAAGGLAESGASLSKTQLLDSAASKTHLLDALFQGRKASQDNSSPLKLRSHTKSESIDSGSSASSYSIASECATLPGDLASTSTEALDSQAGSPVKAPGSGGGGRLKKFPSNRSFSVASLTPKLNKLPEMATNIRRRMSNQFAQAGHQVGVDLYIFQCGLIPDWRVLMQ